MTTEEAMEVLRELVLESRSYRLSRPEKTALLTVLTHWQNALMKMDKSLLETSK